MIGLAALALGLTTGAHAQSPALSLRRALTEADRSGPAIRIAVAESADQQAQALGTLRGVLPSVRVEAGWLRTTDPMGTFGTTLRQRAITAADFDPHRLNHPGAVSNYQGGLVVEQPLLSVDVWAGRRAARRAADASRAAEAWTRLATRTEVIRVYYGAVLAAERARTLATAERAARAHVAQAEALVRNGLATRSDALLAAIRAADVQAQRVEADAAVTTARRELGVTLGRSDAGEAEVPATLPASERIRAVVARDTASADESIRADVESAERGLDAARAEVDRARTALLPRLNSFARYDWYSAARPYAGDRTWTVGVMASWSLFAGASDLADIRATNARADAARAAADASLARARLDAERTRTTLAVALTRLGIAERAVAQSADAHRIVARKYEGGLATVVELLDAQAVEMQTMLAFAEARYRAITAAAERRQAVGGDPATLAALDEDGSVPASDPTPH